MADLSTTYGPLNLKNPLVIGAGPTTHTPEICERAAQSGWAGVVLKTYFASDMRSRLPADKTIRPSYALSDAPGIARWRPRRPKSEDVRSRGRIKLGKIPEDYALLMNFPIDRTRSYVGPGTYYIDRYVEYINRTKELVAPHGCKVIASITAFAEEGFKEAVDLINQSNADGVEVMLSCAFVGALHPDTGEWYSGGQAVYPKNVTKFTRMCAERLRKDIAMFVKLPPHCPDPVGSFKAAVEAGATGIEYADGDLFRNYPIRPIVLDPDTEEVGLFNGFPFATSLGSISLPFIMGGITLFRSKGFTVDIAGCGGVRNYKDVIRLLMCGATSVQVCTATMVEGVGVASEWLGQLESWMNKKGHKSLKDIVGVIDKSRLKMDLSKLDPVEVPLLMGGPAPSVIVECNKDDCINCGWCSECCFHLAIKMDSQLPVFDRKLCEVCGMCVAVCPTQCLSIVAAPD